MWALLSAIFFLTLLGALVCLIFKRLRGKATWCALASFVGLVTSMIISGGEFEESAREKGFLSAADFRQAKEAGIADPAAWRAEQEKAKATAFAAVETKKDADARAEARRAQLLRQPPEQANFIKAAERGRMQFKSGQNDLQRGAARPSRANEICTALPEPQLKGWIGTVATLSTNGDGDGVVSIKIAEKLHFETWNNLFSDIGTDTLIKAGSPLYRTLLNMKVGDFVRFNGRMFSSRQDCHREKSLTLAGSLNDPAFLVRFSKIERVELP